MAGAIQDAVTIVREHRRAYLALNILYYGLILAGMAYVVFNPSLQQELLEAVGLAFTQGPLVAVGEAYTGGELVLAALLTFVVNLIIGSAVWITLPSLIIPFSGIASGALRALLWGFLFSPVTPEIRSILIPHSITLILEGQAYILAMLAAYIQGRSFLWPGTIEARNHVEGYIRGALRSLRLYILVALVLAVAAVYEALEVILLIPA